MDPRMSSFALSCLFLVIASMTQARSQHVRDPHSFARPEAVVTHLALDIEVDFDKHVISGAATLTLRLDPKATEVHLDTRDLNIHKVTLLPEKSAPKWTLGEEVKFLGRELTIAVTPKTTSIVVEYSTSPSAAALQWLEPLQTAGKKKPFLFTQSQAILARTWVPCQDGPSIRMTYSARVKTRPDLLAVMSASNPVSRSSDGVYTFDMKQPIPSYLLALAVGDIAFRPVGKRSGVYAEHALVDTSAWELGDTEKMIEAAEALYGPYRWDRYDIIVLPPSFPFGGMENPRLTFATPTILAGDRSLVSLVAHELAHSWSGNLVTNATWSDFWLNEGFTSYLENRIMEALYGRPYAEMLASLALQDLQNTLKDLGPTHPDTRLKIDLTGRDPDEGVSDVAYNKGALFLRHCEETVGRARWDAYVRSYFDSHAFTSMTTEGFVADLRNRLVAGNADLEGRLQIDAWVYGPGLPESIPAIASSEFAAVEKEAAQWTSGIPAVQLSTKGWTTHHWLHFLRKLPATLSVDRMKELDGAFAFTRSGNSEILTAWLQRSIEMGYAQAYGALEHFLTGQGRRKFLKPLYTAMTKSPGGMQMAKRIYAKARPGYHSVSYNTIDDILKWDVK